MLVVSLPRGFPAEEKHRVGLQFVRLVVRSAAWLRQEIEARRGIRQLAELDDRLLRDIALVRSDVEAAVRRSYEAENLEDVNSAATLLPRLPAGRR